MTSASELEQNCVRDYRRYSDTVAVCCAIYHLFSKQPDLANFVGIEHELLSNNGHPLTPEVVATFDNDQKGLILEFKWSLPMQDDLLEKEIRELKKYVTTCTRWRPSVQKVAFQDLILICHIDDAQRVVKKIKSISKDSEHSFLAEEGFAVWSWTITPPKKGERKEEMRLFSVYGKTRNQKMEQLISQPGGILFSEDALTYLRFTFTFIKEKPPLQYTMTVLIQNILSTFQGSPEREFYDIHVDMIYERARSFFPSWREHDTQTVQIRRGWIKEALEKLCELRLCSVVLDKENWWKIPIPILRTRKPIQEVLCKKIAEEDLRRLKGQRRGRPRLKVTHPRPTKKDRTMTEFLR